MQITGDPFPPKVRDSETLGGPSGNLTSNAVLVKLFTVYL